MTNYSCLQQNTLDGLSETAGCLYLKLCDVFQGDERRALFAACRYEDRLGGTLDFILRTMPNAPTPETRAMLSQFFSERYRHNFMDCA